MRNVQTGCLNNNGTVAFNQYRIRRILGNLSAVVGHDLVKTNMIGALMLANCKNLYEGIKETKNHSWSKLSGTEIYGKTLGIIGFGAIGKHLANMANALGMNVLCYDAYPINEVDALGVNARISDLDTIYAVSDFISIHVPLNDETRGMISFHEMKKMKSSCVLINNSAKLIPLAEYVVIVHSLLS